jgi:hypothetical protein
MVKSLIDVGVRISSGQLHVANELVVGKRQGKT